MMDKDIFESIIMALSNADNARAGTSVCNDGFGDVHILLFGDLKQLPPATGRAPFIVLKIVHGFEYRVLRENRRVVQDETRRDEIEAFHQVLMGHFLLPRQ